MLSRSAGAVMDPRLRPLWRKLRYSRAVKVWLPAVVHRAWAYLRLMRLHRPKSNDPSSAKSLVSVRFIRTNNSSPRFNFVGASEYPATENSAFFACVHATGQ